MNLRLQPVRLATDSADQDSRLIFSDEYLVAIVVKLSEAHVLHAGHWFVEASFGRVEASLAPLFTDLEAVLRWITKQLL